MNSGTSANPCRTNSARKARPAHRPMADWPRTDGRRTGSARDGTHSFRRMRGSALRTTSTAWRRSEHGAGHSRKRVWVDGKLSPTILPTSMHHPDAPIPPLFAFPSRIPLRSTSGEPAAVPPQFASFEWSGRPRTTESLRSAKRLIGHTERMNAATAKEAS